jgi:hypothetical protein
MFAKFVRDAAAEDFRMSCVPWQSPQVAATELPFALALPCTVA